MKKSGKWRNRKESTGFCQFSTYDTPSGLVVRGVYLERYSMVAIVLHEQISRSIVQSQARVPVFKSPSNLGTYLSVHCIGGVDFAQTGNRTRTCGVEARYATTGPHLNIA
ncbi:hypothetical protein TNCV_1894081 [Trichonephila clavipes]|nr:hypothetical protein TNCV_1894081 [Trichonephila clavipes]